MDCNSERLLEFVRASNAQLQWRHGVRGLTLDVGFLRLPGAREALLAEWLHGRQLGNRLVKPLDGGTTLRCKLTVVGRNASGRDVKRSVRLRSASPVNHARNA